MNECLIQIEHQSEPSLLVRRQRLQIGSWLWLKVEDLLQNLIIFNLLLQLRSCIVLPILLLSDDFLLFIVGMDPLPLFYGLLLLFLGFFLEELESLLLLDVLAVLIVLLLGVGLELFGLVVVAETGLLLL